jgi:drug/metabolite transporter (DMT)-like permease
MSWIKTSVIPGDKNEKLALLALTAGAVGISLSAIFVRLSDVDPTASAFYRTAFAVPLFLIGPYLLPNSRNNSGRGTGKAGFLPGNKKQLLLLFLAGLFFAGDLGFWHLSIGMTSVANATLLPNMAPILVTFVAWYLFNEKITGRFLLGLVVAVIGAIIVLGDSLGRAQGHIKGDLLAFGVMVFYAGYLLVVSQLRQSCTTLTIMTWSSLATALILLSVCLISGQNLVPEGFEGWLVLLGLAWISHAGGQGMIAFALAHLPVSFSSVGLLLQPAMAALFAFLFLGEPVGLWQGTGAVVVLGGIYLARLGSSR